MAKAVSVIPLLALHLALLSFALSIPVEKSIFKDAQLYEGNPCQLENGEGFGVCTKAINCPRRMQQIEMRNYSHVGRCGFSHFDEIVCCAINSSGELKTIRPADVACSRYREVVSKLEDGVFHIVVFNGVRANRGEFPQMAALGYAASNDEEGAINGTKYVCGGTLVSEKHVITAAHCVHNIQGLVPFEVLLGTIDLTNPNSGSMQRIPISRVVRHPEYKRSLNYHDVAILELMSPVKITSDVHPTCLPTSPPTTSNEFPAGLVVLGWGAIDLDGTTSTRLLKAVGLKFVAREDCSKSYKHVRAQIPNGLDDGMTCVVDANSTRKADTCWGDSGGPLLMSSTKFAPIVGVTSFGQACGGSTPGVYASVYKYLDWIEAQIWPSSD